MMRFIVFAEDKSEIEELLSDNFVNPAAARLYRVVKSKNHTISLNFHNLVLKNVSRNYKFHNPEGIYFVSFAVVEWLDNITIFRALDQK